MSLNQDMVKVCKNCSQNFEITDEDLKFYEKVSPEFNGKKYLIPEPSLCQDCRLQRRLSWRNERKLYNRSCDKCKSSIVSIFSPNSKTPIYCNKCWWSDDFDAKIYGMDFNFSKNFFEQLKELIQKVPQLAIQNDDGVSSINCQYCQDFAFGKNCYFVIGSWYSENCFYCNVNASYDKFICDCINVSKSELVYESVDSQNLYNCKFMQNCENSSDCIFGFDLKGCKNCIACIGLRQKEFHIFNQAYTEEEYKNKILEFNLNSHEGLKKLENEFRNWILDFPRKNMNLKNCENSTGNNLFNCKNTYGFSLLDAEDCKFCDQGDSNKFSYDIFNSGRPNWCYEGMTPDDSYMTHFSWFSWKNKFLLYGLNCHSSEYLFGCASLHRANYCILNKQYTKEEYEKLVPQIIEHMTKTGEFGEFFPSSISPFGYNETVAQEYFPLTRDIVRTGRDLSLRWSDFEPEFPKVEKIIPANLLPDNINEIPDDILNWAIECEITKKPFKIIKPELDFYRKMNLPIPHLHPDERHKARMMKRNPRKLFDRNCMKCNAEIKTTYSQEREEIVYCEKCYLESVY